MSTELDQFRGPMRSVADQILDAVDPRIAALPAGTITAALDLAFAVADELPGYPHPDIAYTWAASLTAEQFAALTGLAEEQNPQ